MNYVNQFDLGHENGVIKITAKNPNVSVVHLATNIKAAEKLLKDLEAVIATAKARASE